MSVRRAITEKDGIYFMTFTSKNWLPLFELTNSYDAVYKGFYHLKANGHYITGYVILPNHLHVLVGFKALTQSINTLISNGKRFIAYEIIKRLQEQNNDSILETLSDAVTESHRRRGKLHQVLNHPLMLKNAEEKFSSTKSFLICTTTHVREFGT
jgi:hypothetical protein